MRLLIAAVLALIAAPAFADPTIPTNDIISGAITNYIRPSFAQFDTDTSALKTDMTALCATPSASALATAQSGFKTVALSYSRAEFMYFGPLTVGDRASRLLYWPDKKGIGLRQVKQVLAAKDPTAASPDTLKNKSVALQGLGALEFVLFGTDSDSLKTADGAYRCSFGGAIATLVNDLTSTLNTEWQDTSSDGPEAHMLDPKSDAQDYRTQKEVLGKLAGAMIVGVETIRDQRLTPIIGAAEGGPHPRSALFWRSGMSMPALAANFQGIEDFFRAARFADATTGDAWIAKSAIFEVDNAVKALNALTGPVDQITADPEGVTQLNYLVNITQVADTLLGDNLSASLGLTLGFSALDGD
jgi:hypothetical protein